MRGHTDGTSQSDGKPFGVDLPTDEYSGLLHLLRDLESNLEMQKQHSSRGGNGRARGDTAASGGRRTGPTGSSDSSVQLEGTMDARARISPQSGSGPVGGSGSELNTWPAAGNLLPRDGVADAVDGPKLLPRVPTARGGTRWFGGFDPALVISGAIRLSEIGVPTPDSDPDSDSARSSGSGS